MCTPALFALLRWMAEPTRFLFPSFPPEISSFLGTSIAITRFGTQEVLPTPAGRKYSTGSFFLTSSPSMTQTHPPFSIAPLLTFFAPSSLALSWSWEVLQDLGSDHPSIFLSIPLSPVYRPNERPPSFTFQKACWDDLDSHCPSAEEYSSLSSAAAAAAAAAAAFSHRQGQG